MNNLDISLVRTVQAHSNWVRTCCFARQSKFFITGSDDHTVKVWDTEEFQEIKTLNDHKDTVLCSAITPDDRYIISGSSDKTLKVWDTNTLSLVKTLNQEAKANLLSISPNGRILLVGLSNGLIKEYEIPSFSEIRILTKYKGCSICSICFSADGTYFAASILTIVKLFDSNTFQELGVLKGHKDGINMVCFFNRWRKNYNCSC